jgi:O-antigen/teichoic acid export membrane protein
MAAIFTFDSKEIVNLLFGKQYLSSSLSASILYWCQVFIFFSTYSLSVLIASNNQKYNFIYSLIQVVVNIGLCFLLIPDYSYFGAAIAKLIASFISFAFILYSLSKLNFKLSIGRYRVLTWSIVVSIFLWLAAELPLYVYLILAVIIVSASTLLIGFFSEKELMIFFRLIKKEQLGSKILSKFQFVNKIPL